MFYCREPQKIRQMDRGTRARDIRVIRVRFLFWGQILAVMYATIVSAITDARIARRARTAQCHSIDLTSAVLDLILFPVGYLLHAISPKYHNGKIPPQRA